MKRKNKFFIILTIVFIFLLLNYHNPPKSVSLRLVQNMSDKMGCYSHAVTVGGFAVGWTHDSGPMVMRFDSATFSQTRACDTSTTTSGTTTALPPTTKVWVVDGAPSSTWSATLNQGYMDSCPSQSAALSTLQAAHPAANQNINDRGRVIGITNDDGFISCVQWFRVIEH